MSTQRFTVRSVRNAGFSLAYPSGCYEVILDFLREQHDPNFGPGWGLGNFGHCKDYQGIRTPDFRMFTGVVAYYDGEPNFAVGKLRPDLSGNLRG